MPRVDPQDQMRIAKRRMDIARMYLQGKTHYEIAEKFGVSQATVCNDLVAIREEWVERATMDFDQRKAEELARLDRLEAKAWEGYERSCEDAVIMRRRQEFIRERRKKGAKKVWKLTPVGQTQDETKKGQAAGDPRFLEQIERCITLRMKVFGMLKGDTINQAVQVIDFSGLIGRTEEVDPAEKRIEEVKLLTGITTQPKHLELHGQGAELTPEQQIEQLSRRRNP